jgi:hypothetical protein
MTTRIDAIKARLQAATKGPLHCKKNLLGEFTLFVGGYESAHNQVGYARHESDASLWAHSPTDLALLLRVAEQAVEARRHQLEGHDLLALFHAEKMIEAVGELLQEEP